MKERIRSFQFRHARMVREIVEVVAIVLAGLWALYVFVYENGIRPELAPPTPSFSIAMRHVGNHGSLAVIRLDETIRNVGVAPVMFLAYSVTVVGSTVVPLASPQRPLTARSSNDLTAYYRFGRRAAVYRDAFVTEQGGAAEGRGLFVNPGQTTVLSREFYAPRERFDHLTAYIVAVYVNSTARIPTTMTIKPDGVPQFSYSSRAPVEEISAPLADVDLMAE